MQDFEAIVTVKQENTARVLITALRAHGFSPRDYGDGGLPGITTALSGAGIAIWVPVDEARDAKPLAEALLADMDG